MHIPAKQTFAIATDDLIEQLIGSATRRLVVVAPAVCTGTAQAICDRLTTLRAEDVTLVFDSDPEVYRLGFGDIEGLQLLQRKAQQARITLRRQPGVRIGLVVADSETLIFTPTARLVEAGPNSAGTANGANAIRLSSLPGRMEAELGLDGGPPSVGGGDLTLDDFRRVKANLEANPPLRFDIARKMRVFTSFIEFVEIEVRGTDLSRQMVSIPPHLLAVADAKTKEQLRTSFRLVPAGDALSGSGIDKDRKLLVGRYLRVIPGFGSVVLVREKNKLKDGLLRLQESIDAFAEKVRSEIQQRIDTTIAELKVSLLPALTARPPIEWTLSTGKAPNADELAKLLEEELRRAFGTADRVVGKMQLHYVFKAVTHEMLTNEEFRKVATRVIPELERLHDESDAVKGTAEPT